MIPTLLLLKTAYITGWMVAAPIGPVNLEIIQRGLRQRPLAGFMVGLGAICIDGMYLLLFSLGLRLVMQWPWVQSLLFVLGGALLCWLAVRSLRDGVRLLRQSALAADAVAKPPVSLRGCYLIGLAMTGSNPMTIAFWSALSLQFTELAMGLRLLACGVMMLGCLSWVLLVTGIIAFARRWIGPRMMGTVTLVGGTVVLLYGLFFLARGLGVMELLARAP